jgi:putative membrane protein
MGAADIVPGVSGGTVALLVGIYERLLTAISGIGPQSLSALLKGRFRDFARLVDLRFLLVLAAGIGTSLVALAHLMHYLLDDHRQPTLAVFFGLIAASGLLVARMARPTGQAKTAICLVLAVGAMILAAWVVMTPTLEPRPGNAYLFACGAIAICAMILPGISGAYILIILGKYEEITGALKDSVSKVLHLQFDASLASLLVTVVVFIAGCLTGLLLFSRLLKWLLQRAYAETMAVLAGFMLGSLVKVWPYQGSIDLKAPADPKWPTSIDGMALLCLGLAVASCAFVLVADRIARRN